MLYDAPGGHRVGYATSFVYSPVLQEHIALARVRPHLGQVGTELHLEVTVNHSTTTVLARTVRTPFFNPARRTASA
jgi:aminomethyltransferase